MTWSKYLGDVRAISMTIFPTSVERVVFVACLILLGLITAGYIGNV